MNFFADESLDRQIITRLRQDGHVVLDVTEMDPGISKVPCLDAPVSLIKEDFFCLHCRAIQPSP